LLTNHQAVGLAPGAVCNLKQTAPPAEQSDRSTDIYNLRGDPLNTLSDTD